MTKRFDGVVVGNVGIGTSVYLHDADVALAVGFRSSCVLDDYDLHTSQLITAAQPDQDTTQHGLATQP